jgi:hypothetical protein
MRPLHFSLEEIRYDYPLETVPPGMTPRRRCAASRIEGARNALSRKACRSACASSWSRRT